MEHLSVIDIDQSNAQQYLIDESFSRPVLVDFWADWCEPCKALMPVLEKLAAEFFGRFLLARVNADTQQMISSQFGVRSLPTVMLMKDGQPVDGFTGAQTEVQVREFLAKHLPKPWDEAAASAKLLLEQGDAQSALPILQQASSESAQQANIQLLWAQALLMLNRVSAAEELLATIRMADQDEHYHLLMSQLELAQQAAKAPEIEQLESQLAQSPDDIELTYLLSIQYGQHKYFGEALDMLYRVLQRDLGYREGEARRSFNDILAVLGKGDPLAIHYQRKLYTLLY